MTISVPVDQSVYPRQSLIRERTILISLTPASFRLKEMHDNYEIISDTAMTHPRTYEPATEKVWPDTSESKPVDLFPKLHQIFLGYSESGTIVS